jgi:nucleoside-diphosphate-sugar epimerase
MQISILGCGWLGFSLAKHLIKQGHAVKGSTTSKDKIKELENCGIEPYLVEFNPQLSTNHDVPNFWHSDVLVLNIPPGHRRNKVIDYHTKQIRSIIEAISGSPIKYVVFISSTSVYPKLPGLVVEDDAIPGKAGRDSGNALLQAEKMLTQANNFETTVLRFGGLYGGDRHPTKYMAGRKNLSKANAPVNLIHRDDCIAIITQLVEEKITGEIFNAVADNHPTRKEYYTKAAEALGLKPPTFKQNEQEKKYKVVSNMKLKKILPYSFIYPEPIIPFHD